MRIRTFAKGPWTALAAAALLIAACGGEEAGLGESPGTSFRGYQFPPSPIAPSGPGPEGIEMEIVRLQDEFKAEEIGKILAAMAATGDARLAWVLADYAWFNPSPRLDESGIEAFRELTGVDIREDPSSFRFLAGSMIDHLIAWDLPAVPSYLDLKRIPFERLEPRWKPFFDDRDSDIDWRLVTWGGVFIDDRPFGHLKPCPRSCIPSLDNPAVTDAAGGDWYPDHEIVFGVVVNGEARAYPKNMEVHEMVNDGLGGRRIGIPYCTLCGAAQAYYLDDLDNDLPAPVLRTSGLLLRSNKLMYDLSTFSAIDTFTGRALSGPLREAGVNLTPITVVASTWGRWKDEHPETTIVAQDGGIGRFYLAEPLRDRDDAGPIFPIGDVDGRLYVHAQVLGVIAPDGTPVAFPAESASAALHAGEPVELGGIVIVAEGSGLRATSNGEELASNQAFWFAWSQFHPETLLWERAARAND